MLEFELTEEQSMLVDAIGRFNDDTVSKNFRDADEEGEIPESIIQSGWEFGLIPTSIPEEFGGFGEYSALTSSIAMEEFAAGDLATSLRIFQPALLSIPILLDGTPEQRAKYLPMFCEADAPRVTAALTEPGIQFDPRGLVTSAELSSSGYVLNGRKCLVLSADQADTVLVYANEDNQTQAFLVPAESEGLQIGGREKLMGLRGMATYNLSLTDCRIPISNKVGLEDGIDFDRILNHSRVALGAAAVGMARAAHQYALDYAKNRVQFGEPIAHRQSIAFMLAEMAISVEAARMLVWEAAWQLDGGNDATRETTVMKHFADDMVLKIADQTVQILGGYGYIREYPAELWLRNARGFTSFDGLAII
jgi:alkylation response protein AidB-like acyl-CoA dehydrogenase